MKKIIPEKIDFAFNNEDKAPNNEEYVKGYNQARKEIKANIERELDINVKIELEDDGCTPKNKFYRFVWERCEMDDYKTEQIINFIQERL